MSLFYCSYHEAVEDSDTMGHVVVGFVESCNVGAGIAEVPEKAALSDAQKANRYMLAALRGVLTGTPADKYVNVLSPDQLHAVKQVAALAVSAKASERRVAAVTALVRTAYDEGWDTGTYDAHDEEALNSKVRDSDWEYSKARAALAAASGAADTTTTTPTEKNDA